MLSPLFVISNLHVNSPLVFTLVCSQLILAVLGICLFPDFQIYLCRGCSNLVATFVIDDPVTSGQQ